MEKTIRAFIGKMHELKFALCMMHHDSGPAMGGMDITRDVKGNMFIHFKIELLGGESVNYVVKLDDIIQSTDMENLATTIKNRKDVAKEERLEELKKRVSMIRFTKMHLETTATDIESGKSLEILKNRIASKERERANVEGEIATLERDLGIG